MTHDLDPLVLDLVEWVATRPRPYAEVMEAWRTSCPRLAVWEDAVDQGLVVRESGAGTGAVVRATPLGLSRLRREGRLPTPPPSAEPDAAARR